MALPSGQRVASAVGRQVACRDVMHMLLGPSVAPRGVVGWLLVELVRMLGHARPSSKHRRTLCLLLCLFLSLIELMGVPAVPGGWHGCLKQSMPVIVVLCVLLLRVIVVLHLF